MTKKGHQKFWALKWKKRTFKINSLIDGTFDIYQKYSRTSENFLEQPRNINSKINTVTL